MTVEVVDRALDQTRAVVHRNDLDAFGQTGLQRLQLLLHRGDRLQRVLARAHHDHAAGGFAFAVEFADTASQLGPDLNPRHIAEPHRDAGGAGRQRNLPEVVERLQVARRAHHVFGFAELEHRAAGLLIGLADRIDHLRVRDAVRGELVGIEHDLILAHHAADRSDFGDIGHRLQLVPQKPVLQRAQLRNILRAAAVDQRILVDPADAGCVRAERSLRCRR